MKSRKPLLPLVYCANKLNRRRVKKELISDLEIITRCCQPQGRQTWPSAALLERIEHMVFSLYATESVKSPSPAWKCFRLLHRREQGLNIVVRIDSLVGRARHRLEKVGESMLSKLARQGGAEAGKLLRDIERVKNDTSAAKEIHWTQHERALARFSRTHSVELASNPNSALRPEIRCYTRTLELIVDDYRREPLRRVCRPLLEWVTRIGHPKAGSLLAFDYAIECDVKRKGDASQKEHAARQRENDARRMRWYREDKNFIKWREKSKSKIIRVDGEGECVWDESLRELRKIYPGGWVCIQLNDGFVPADRIPDPPICQFCKKPETEQFWLFNLVSNKLGCDLCQPLEWIARGYDTTRDGLAIWSHPPDKIGPRR